MFPWMLCKIELCTQPRVSVHKENCLSPASSWSTSTTVGLNTKILTSKFLLLKGTKHAIWSLFSLAFFLCFFSGNSNESKHQKLRGKSVWNWVVIYMGWLESSRNETSGNGSLQLAWSCLASFETEVRGD